jgi:UDP-N-acetylglucosamine/UDP-N-acetylgalactosamine diphosphorylase
LLWSSNFPQNNFLQFLVQLVEHRKDSLAGLANMRMAAPSGAAREPIPAELRDRFLSAGQGHVFDFADRGLLDAAGTAALVQQLQQIDPARVNDLFARAMTQDASSSHAELQPFTAVPSAVSAPAADKQAWLKAGLAAVAQGAVAAVTLAGGQGTRLGFDGPKGLYSIGLPSGKSLFQLQAERIQRLCTLAERSAGADQGSVHLPWYIMTSPLNNAATRQYFAEQRYFGLLEKNLFFFQQGTLPCMTLQGKIMLASAGAVAEAPDGNGGLYSALHSSGALDDMARRGVTCLHAFRYVN